MCKERKNSKEESNRIKKKKNRYKCDAQPSSQVKTNLIIHHPV